MLLFEEALYQTLAADSALAALVGTRIYGPVLEQGAAFPAITIQAISDIPEMSHSGDSGLVMTRIQMTVFGKCHLDTLRVCFRLEQMFQAFRGSLGVTEAVHATGKKANRYVIPREPNQNVWMSAIDFIFYYNRELNP